MIGIDTNVLVRLRPGLRNIVGKPAVGDFGRGAGARETGAGQGDQTQGPGRSQRDAGLASDQIERKQRSPRLAQKGLCEGATQVGRDIKHAESPIRRVPSTAASSVEKDRVVARLKEAFDGDAFGDLQNRQSASGQIARWGRRRHAPEAPIARAACRTKSVSPALIRSIGMRPFNRASGRIRKLRIA